MALTGTFNSYDNSVSYTVIIDTDNGTITDPLKINTEQNAVPIMFAPDPVTIRCDRGDLTKRIIISQATINLVSSENLTEELFASTNRSIPVTITCGGSNCFFGYVDPLQFDQGYAHNWETITVTATDPLAALEQLDAGDLTGITAASSVTPSNLINAIFAAAEINSGGISAPSAVTTAMGNTNLKMSTFFGESEDDWMSLYDILTEVCKYFNLYVSYYGNAAHVSCTINATPSEISITDFKDIAADDSTSLSVDDTYTKIAITAEIEPEDDIIIGFDDDDYLDSDYDNYDKYMSEVISLGEGEDAYNGFYDLLNNGSTTYDGGYMIDHFCWIRKNDLWDFGSGGYTEQTFANQADLLPWMKSTGNAAIIEFGKSNKRNFADNSPLSNISLTKYLVIPSNSSGEVCSFNGLTSAILSPADANLTNYIVISGKILLNPMQQLTGPHWDSEADAYTNTIADCLNAYNNDRWPFINNVYKHTVRHQDAGDKQAYYQQKWYTTNNAYGIYGFLNNSENQRFEYKYNTMGQAVDDITKLPILRCELKVGDKYCIERLDKGETGVGKFQWMTAEECTSEGITDKVFTIGIDPKLGDNIIGQSFSIQNNVNYQMGIEKTGTAIPITSDDHLAGEITFKILGPYNILWDEVSHATNAVGIFRPPSQGEENVLDYVQSIMVSNLKIEADNKQSDNDLVYTLPYSGRIKGSTLEDSVKICTPLTLQECKTYGIKPQISNSYVYYTNNEPFLGFGGSQGPQGPYTKPEECLTDYYYQEYKDPAKMISTAVRSDLFASAMYGASLNNEMMNTGITGIYPDDSNHYMIMSYETSLKYLKTDITFRRYFTYNYTQI